MAYQLWSSPTTGYRRTGTRLAEVRGLFSTGITVESIFEPLKSCPADEDCSQIKETMRMRDFDVLGVLEEKDGPVIGFVNRTDLKSGVVRDFLREITPEKLISESTPIVELFTLFSHNNYLFVLDKTKVEGIVTQADLNKPPVRIYLFGLISLIEMHLSFWIRNKYREDSWQNGISEGRIKKANDLLKLRKEKNQEIDLFECLQFCDKSTLLLKNSDLRNMFNIESRSKGEKVLNRVERLRDSLAHSQENISKDMSWKKVFNTVFWIEDFLTTSDRSIEQLAAVSSEEFDDQLQ